MISSFLRNAFLFSVISTLSTLNFVSAQEPSPSTPQKSAVSATPSKLYRHVVLFQFKKEASEAQIKAIEEAFAKLPSKIDTVVGYEWGRNVSPEGLDSDLTHVFLVTFADQKGFETYLHHPEHLEFVKLLKPSLEKAVVLDYVTP